MPERIIIDQLSISGFRAYLQEQTFHLSENGKAKSLAVFAPNAKGKSSLVDALEFYFSDDGTLERLGQRRSGTQAGFEALRHVRIVNGDFASKVSIAFHGSDGQFGDSREVSASNVPAVRTGAADRVLGACKMPFIIRGYELRKFVDQQTPQDRYKDVCRWFDFSPLLDMQRNLRDLRLRLKRELDKDSATAERLKDLQKITLGKVTCWEEKNVLSWYNLGYLSSLDPSLSVSTLSIDDAAYTQINLRKAEEDKRIGADVLRNAISAIAAIYHRATDDAGEGGSGSLVAFEQAREALDEALKVERQEKARSRAAVFKAVWEAAEKVFEDDAQDISACPVCDTPLSQTSKGGRGQITIHLKEQLASLETYRKAFAALTNARARVEESRGTLRTHVARLQGQLKTAGYLDPDPVMSATETYSLALTSWKESALQPDSEPLRLSISSVRTVLEDKLAMLTRDQGEGTYGKALEIIDALIDLKAEITRIRAVSTQLQSLLQRLSNIEEFIAARIRAYLQSLIDSLRDSVNALYRCVHVQEGQAPGVTLALAEDKEPKLNLFVDFSPNREGVVPSGYLSDSQMHTLALSLRLAAIRSSNAGFPVVVLDDVVTSYDADHRKAVATMLATHFADFQIIIVTHDERFFCYLQDHLPRSDWRFRRILYLDPDYGPRFHDHRVTEQMIVGKWDNGQSAANELRQAEEEWLLEKAREFGVNIRIRDVHNAYSYERGELAMSIAAFLKESKVGMPPVSGHANPFLASLQKGDVENFGSHFQDNPQAWSSIGDEKSRWQELKEFFDLFRCQSCGFRKFKRPRLGVKRALCEKCEEPLSFAALVPHIPVV